MINTRYISTFTGKLGTLLLIIIIIVGIFVSYCPIQVAATVCPKEEWRGDYKSTPGVKTECWDIQQTTDGGYIIAGFNESQASSRDAYLLKINDKGKMQWDKAFGGGLYDEACAVQQTTDGGYIIAGWTQSFSSNNKLDAWLIKTNQDGAEVWNKTFGGPGNDKVTSVQQTTDGGYIVTGSMKFADIRSYEVFLIKLDQNGSPQWPRERTYGSKYDDVSFTVKQTDDGYVIFGVSTVGVPGSDIYETRPLIIKTAKNGELVRQINCPLGNNRYTAAEFGTLTSDGDFVVAGRTQFNEASDYKTFILRMDKSENEVWNSTFLWGPNTSVRSVQLTKDHGFVVAGATGLEPSSQAGNVTFGNIFVMKLLPDVQTTFEQVQDSLVTVIQSYVPQIIVGVIISVAGLGFTALVQRRRN